MAIGYTRLFVNRRKIDKNSMEISEMNNTKITKFWQLQSGLYNISNLSCQNLSKTFEISENFGKNWQ